MFLQEKEKLLDESQVEAVMQFAQGLYVSEKYGVGAYSPWLSNSLLNNLNNNAKIPTSAEIKSALSAYKENAENLQNYMQFMKYYDMLFSRTLIAYANALSFDAMVYCTNAYTQSDIESDTYASDKIKFYNFLNKFDYKAEFRKVLQQVIINEVYHTWFRKTKWGNKGMKCALQILPQEYCMITGYWEKGLLVDFDMNYFLQAGVDIDQYDPVFKKYYNRVFNGDGKIGDYVPSSQLNERTGEYAQYVQTSPAEGQWSWKFDMSNFNVTPFLAPFLKDAIHNREIEELQYNKDIASAFGILAGEIRLFDNAKSGTTANQFAIDPNTLGKFLGLVKSGIGNTVKAVAMPTANTDFYQFEDKNPDMYNNALVETAGVGSSISRVIYSTDRMSSAEVEAGQLEMYNIMKPMYSQFANFINFYANKLTSRYKFNIVFDGSNYKWERQQRFDNLLKLADKGLVLNESAYSSIIGMTPMQLEAMLLEGKYGGITSKLSMLLNANTMKDGGDGGRPSIDSSQLSDSGEMNRDE